MDGRSQGTRSARGRWRLGALAALALCPAVPEAAPPRAQGEGKPAAAAPRRPVLVSPVFGRCVLHAGGSERSGTAVKLADGGARVLAAPRDQCWFNLECAGGGIAVDCTGARCTCTLDVGLPGVKPATLPVEVQGACADSGEKVLLEQCLPWAPEVARSWPRRTPSARWGDADAGTTAAPSEPQARPAAPVVLPSAWTACRADADCTFVSLGCCDPTPVNRAYAADAQRKLDASGRPFCAPKAACAPTRGGTWAGEPGRCHRGVCAPVD